MVTEQATVAEVSVRRVWVNTQARSACGGCAAKAGCGQNLLARLFGEPPPLLVELPAEFSADLQVGDRIEIGVAERAVLTASLLTYGLPIVVMIIAIALAEHFMPQHSVLAAVGGLTAGFLATRGVLRKLFNPQYFVPVVIRRLPQSQQGEVVR